MATDNRDREALSRERIAASDFQPLTEAATQKPSGRGPLRALALAAIGLVALLVLGFLFTARSVQIAVEAESPHTIDIDGLALPLGERFLIRSGDYDLRVSAPGYLEHTGILSVSGE